MVALTILGVLYLMVTSLDVYFHYKDTISIEKEIKDIKQNKQ